MNGCPATNATPAYARGFTLLELAVVLFIIGLVLVIAMPHMGGFGDAQMKSAARRLASRINYLYQEAGAQKVVLRITFDLDRDRCLVTRMDPFASEPWFMPERGPDGALIELGGNVRFRDVSVEGAGTYRKGTVSTQFYPDGAVDATVIHLVDQNRTVFTLAVDPFNGHVAIRRGDFNPLGTRRASQ